MDGVLWFRSIWPMQDVVTPVRIAEFLSRPANSFSAFLDSICNGVDRNNCFFFLVFCSHDHPGTVACQLPKVVVIFARLDIVRGGEVPRD